MPDIVALQQAWDRRWFGAVEHDEAEVRESLAGVLRSARRVACCWMPTGWSPQHGGGQMTPTLLVHPDADAAPAYDQLLTWLARRGAMHLEALERDELLRDALGRHGWGYVRSQFELIRRASPLPPARWPDGVTTTPMGDHARAAYRVIYDESGLDRRPRTGPARVR